MKKKLSKISLLVVLFIFIGFMSIQGGVSDSNTIFPDSIYDLESMNYYTESVYDGRYIHTPRTYTFNRSLNFDSYQENETLRVIETWQTNQPWRYQDANDKEYRFTLVGNNNTKGEISTNTPTFLRGDWEQGFPNTTIETHHLYPEAAMIFEMPIPVNYSLSTAPGTLNSSRGELDVIQLTLNGNFTEICPG